MIKDDAHVMIKDGGRRLLAAPLYEGAFGVLKKKKKSAERQALNGTFRIGLEPSANGLASLASILR